MNVERKEENQFFNRIVVPIDGSELSKKAAQIGSFFARVSNVEIVLFHVNQIPATAIPPGEATYTPNLSETIKKQGESLLDEMKKLLSDQEVNIQTKMIEGIPSNEIINFTNKDDLIIMGSKGHSAVERILIGSVSEKVLHHSEASVMIVR